MNTVNIDTNVLNEIIKKTITQIDASKEQIFGIVESLRNEQETLLTELAQIRNDLHSLIDEVDILEKQDKSMRQRLAEVSSDFNNYNEVDIKLAYEKASDSRILLMKKRNDENILQTKRTNLELSLKQLIENISTGEKIVNQICIALGFLEGDILSSLKGTYGNSEMTLGIKILEAQEMERTRIARDIHDGPAQHMASVIINVDICKKIIKEDLDAGLRELDGLKAHVKTALAEVRGILFALRPVAIETLGINEAIRDLVEQISKEASLDIQITLMSVEGEIQSIIQIAVYRLVQEIFNNIKRHSKATHAQIKLASGTEYLSLVIADDGIGFDVDKTLKTVRAEGKSYGIIGILDRVAQLQGQIEIKSSKNSGTIYFIKLPTSQEVIQKWKDLQLKS